MFGESIIHMSVGIRKTIIAGLELSNGLEDLTGLLPVLSFGEKSSLLSFWHKL